MTESHHCESPNCSNLVQKEDGQGHYFCKACRERCSYHTLLVQVEYNRPIEEVILEAAEIFSQKSSASNMAAYIGVSFVTMYNWLKKYFDMSFQEFRRVYICRSNNCYAINIKRSSYSRHDYVLKKIRSKRFCACVNALDPDTLMTNAPLSLVSDIFRGNPKIEKIKDNQYSIVTQPVTQEEIGKYPVYGRFDPVWGDND